MARRLRKMRNRLAVRLLLCVGGLLLACICLWGYFNHRYLRNKAVADMAADVDRLSNTIRLGMHYAMMTNARDDIQQIISDVARQNDIENIRIYNKAGTITYSNRAEELGLQTNIKDGACHICHVSEPPKVSVDLARRVRLINSSNPYRRLGIISPVYNESGCSAAACHVHPEDKQVLGALDLVVSMAAVDREMVTHQRNLVMLAVGLYLVTALIIVVLVSRFVTVPVKRLIRSARRIESGDYSSPVQVRQHDELLELAEAINQMGRAIGEKTRALNQQRDEYQTLFETVPCIISVQDREYRLIGYNREFAERFSPKTGDFCYQAYKGRDRKCVVCPVEKTFADGLSHGSEESAVDAEGNIKHWVVRTTPIKDAEGRVVAAMEMNLDISDRRELEEKLAQFEKKYYAIFNNIPNPVFVLAPESLEILDCNNSVASVYGQHREQLLGRSFCELFWEPSAGRALVGITSSMVVERAQHRNSAGEKRYVTIRVSPSASGGAKVLLVTIADITQRLETEQQLIQAGKMATLGEMATGVAHELNQPLSVIKTASSFFMRKLRNKEPLKEDILLTMAEEIDSHVQRATKIINHMRQFGRKSDPRLEPVQINDIMRQAFEIFSQQLRVRGIDVIWEVEKDLPMVMGDAGRLEQVIINLLINARDAIENRTADEGEGTALKWIKLSTCRKDAQVVVTVCDSGIGIPDAIRGRIFEPFFTTKKVGEGTGLGLSISYGIIKECRGEIAVRANPKGGTCFELLFPVAEKMEVLN